MERSEATGLEKLVSEHRARTAILLVAPIPTVIVMVADVSPRDTRSIGTLEHATAAPLRCGERRKDGRDGLSGNGDALGLSATVNCTAERQQKETHCSWPRLTRPGSPVTGHSAGSDCSRHHWHISARYTQGSLRETSTKAVTTQTGYPNALWEILLGCYNCKQHGSSVCFYT